ncbi:YggS family pyridoxal phosphate-dependent enzyme [Nocardiopsis xinjiangensis]|uniref:YggS family pyridoxal phosphate-dependent enzyme n=1 Tax=Nocardiopsis xinjiangensis TaxID=124285 RepID=UPI00034A1F1C|nr:YggS family pyridoxal phosphate-dependent enzyme [Nocardiopsis xinjiangensis]
MPPTDPERVEQVRANLRAARSRIEAACTDSGRDPKEVSLVAVTKTYPADDVRILASLGVTDVGENRDQEAAPKVAETADLDLTWHFVGQLQSNKARSVARYADYVHSVDRAKIARTLGEGAAAAERGITCLVQVNLDEDSRAGVIGSRGGVDPSDTLELADRIEEQERLSIGGVMAVAPLGGDPSQAFARLYEVACRLRDRYPRATAISAGMSGDLEAAIERGATHLRIGTALLGEREPIVG